MFITDEKNNLKQTSATDLNWFFLFVYEAAWVEYILLKTSKHNKEGSSKNLFYSLMNQAQPFCECCLNVSVDEIALYFNGIL